MWSVLLFLVLALGFYALLRILREMRTREIEIHGETVKANPVLRLSLPFISRLAFVNQSLAGPKFIRNTEERLLRAGRPAGLGPLEFLAIKQLSALACALVVLFFLAALGSRGLLVLSPYIVLAIATATALFGYIVPDSQLKGYTRRRQEQMRNDLPFCLDLLTTSVEAGLHFQQAVLEYIRRGLTGPLRDELETLQRHMQLGASHRKALKDFAYRTDLDEIQNLVLSLLQSEEIGSPLGDTLRVQAESIRFKRFQQLEERAQKLSVKLVLPLAVFILPGMLLLTIGPIAMNLARSFGAVTRG